MNHSRDHHPHEILQGYLDELLTEPGPEFADEQALQREKLQKLLYTAAPGTASEQTLERPPPETPAAPSEPAEPPPVGPVPADPEPVAPDPEVEADPAPADEVRGELEWWDNGRPAWAQKRFEVLLFQVSGLTLAVPLIALGQIHPLTGELTPLFGQADWFMGILNTATERVRTVNTARFVMPERYDPQFERSARYVISIHGVPWGLAVDSVKQPISLAPDDVKWRTERSRRPWLAGTVKEHMCALLDIPRIGQLLTEAERRHARA